MIKLFFLLFPVLIVCIQCKPVYYTPNVVNVPLFKEKGEIQAAASAGTGEVTEGFQAQTAYSITNHVGVMANYFMGRGFSSADNRSGKGSLGEGAIGLFTGLEDNMAIEVYTGLGLGNVNRTYDNNSNYSIHLVRYFVQPSFGYTSDYFAISFSARFNYMNWYRVSYITPNTIYRPYEDELQPRKYFQAEPALTIRAGLKNVKLQAQVIASGSDPYLKQERVMAYLGLIVSFNNVLPTSKNKKKGEP